MLSYMCRIASFLALILFSSALLAQSSVVVVPLGSDETTRVFAQADQALAGVQLLGSGMVEFNSIEMNAPSDGFIVVHGSVFVNSLDPSNQTFYLVPLIDGVEITEDFAAAQTLIAGGAKTATLSYSWTHQVEAGVHTVSQMVGPSTGTADFVINKESLTVMFVRTGVVLN